MGCAEAARPPSAAGLTVRPGSAGVVAWAGALKGAETGTSADSEWPFRRKSQPATSTTSRIAAAMVTMLGVNRIVRGFLSGSSPDSDSLAKTIWTGG